MLVLFTVTWALYANSLSNRFTYDDADVVVKNRFLHTETPVRTLFSTNYHAGSGITGDGLYRPLVVLSYMLNTRTPENPFPFHLFNVTLNALNSVLFFLLLFTVSRDIPLAACAALIFGLHPIHTEAVANIAGRPDLMYVFFLLAAWCVFEQYREKAWSSAAAALLFFAALLSKETAVVFPLLVLAYDLAQKRPLFSKAGAFRYASLAAVVIAYLIIRVNVIGHITGVFLNTLDNPVSRSPFPERVATAFDVFSRYAAQMIFPLHLASDYSYNAIPVVSSFFHPETSFGIVVFAGMIAGVFFSFRRNNLVPLAGALFLLPYLVVSNIFFPIGTIRGDRLMYMPLAGFSLGIALFVTPFLKKRNAWMTGAFAVLMLFYSVRAITRNHEWRDNLSLYRADIRTVPNSTRLFTNLGYETTGEESFGYFRRALEIWPGNTDALTGCGVRLYDLGRFGEAEWYYRRVATLLPNNSNAHIDYSIILKKTGHLPEEEHELTEAIRLNATIPYPYIELGTIRIKQERYADALILLKRAEELGGDKKTIFRKRALAQFNSGDVASSYQTLCAARALGITLPPEVVNTILSAVSTGK